MASKYWIKLYLEILDDPKMGRMADWLWRRTIELFLLAGENGNDGELPSVSDMAWRLRLDEPKLSEALRALEQVGVVQPLPNDRWLVTHFKERQDAATSTERVNQFRKREHKRNDIETKRYKNATYTDPESDPESEKKQKEEDDDGPDELPNGWIYRLKPGTIIDAAQAERIYTEVTGMVTIPAMLDQAIETICELTKRRGGGVVEYLRVFYQAQLLTKTKKGNLYPKTAMYWLVTWSVGEDLPDFVKAQVYTIPPDDLNPELRCWISNHPWKQPVALSSNGSGKKPKTLADAFEEA